MRSQLNDRLIDTAKAFPTEVDEECFPCRAAFAMPQAAISGEDSVYQVKAFTRASKDSKRAATACEALRLFRQMQAGSGVTSCAVFQNGVLVSQSELERAANREQNLRA